MDIVFMPHAITPLSTSFPRRKRPGLPGPDKIGWGRFLPIRSAMRTAHGIYAARCPLPIGCPHVCTIKLVHPCGRPPGLSRKKDSGIEESLLFFFPLSFFDPVVPNDSIFLYSPFTTIFNPCILMFISIASLMSARAYLWDNNSSTGSPSFCASFKNSQAWIRRGAHISRWCWRLSESRCTGRPSLRRFL